MKRYPIRLVKYFLFLVILFLVIYAIMYITGYSRISFSQLKIMLLSSQGMLLWILVLVLVALHPYTNYVKRNFSRDISSLEEDITNIMAQNGFSKVSKEGSIVKYKADSFVKKIGMYFEDVIEIDFVYNSVEGSRKEVTKLLFRLDSQLLNR